MGLYLNPGNRGFQTIRNGTYVDKTGLIDYVNSTIDTPQKLTFSSRPRRFGKTFAAKMLCAYYSKSCDSRTLFEGLEISKKDSFDRYLNKYDVIYLDITWFISTTRDIKHVVDDIQKSVIFELKNEFPEYIPDNEESLAYVMTLIAIKTGRGFVVIIDEWDALFREFKDYVQLQKEYMHFLRSLFKNGNATPRAIAAAYMTGILPIKKYVMELSLADFWEFTMLTPDTLTPYVGFTEDEVRALCCEHGIKFENMKQWYDGYAFEDYQSFYNPYSVMSAIWYGEFDNYWIQTETLASLKRYIEMDYEGLKDAVLEIKAGHCVRVRTSTFQNDFVSFHNKDDVLTLLVHLGYLAYDEKREVVYIPNREIAEAFESVMHMG